MEHDPHFNKRLGPWSSTWVVVFLPQLHRDAERGMWMMQKGCANENTGGKNSENIDRRKIIQLRVEQAEGGVIS